MGVPPADAAGREVSELLVQYKERIAAAKTRLADHLGSEEDDIFLLRYCLSYRDDKKMDEAILYRFEYYKLQENKDNAELARQGRWTESKAAKYLLKHLVGGFYSTTKSGAPIFWARPGMNPNLDFVVKGMLAEGLTVQDLCRHLICVREFMYYECDRLTRTTGILTKSIMITDLNDLKAANVMQRELTEANSRASNASSKLFPQLLLKNLLINPPGFFSWAFGVVKKFFSAKALAKMEVFSKTIPLQEQPFVIEWMRVEELPAFVGGSVPEDRLPPQVNGGLLVSLSGDKNATTVKIKSRDDHVVVLPVIAGATIKCTFDVAAYGIHVQAKVVAGSMESDKEGKETFQRSGKVQVLRATGGEEICGHWETEWVCQESGRLAVLFNNKHSVIRSKEVTYKIWQEVPEADASKDVEELEQEVASLDVAGFEP